MKRVLTIFLQLVTALIGTVVLAFLVRFPMTEGRAVNLDLISIYSDPFIIYGYLASISFFIALYQGFKLLGYIRTNDEFSPSAINALRTIKYCATTLSATIIMAVIFVLISHNSDDDPAGFVMMGIVTTFISITVAASAAILEGILKRGGGDEIRTHGPN